MKFVIIHQEGPVTRPLADRLSALTDTKPYGNRQSESNDDLDDEADPQGDHLLDLDQNRGIRGNGFPIEAPRKPLSNLPRDQGQTCSAYSSILACAAIHSSAHSKQLALPSSCRRPVDFLWPHSRMSSSRSKVTGVLSTILRLNSPVFSSSRARRMILGGYLGLSNIECFQESGDAQILVDQRPVNAFVSADPAIGIAFLAACV